MASKKNFFFLDVYLTRNLSGYSPGGSLFSSGRVNISFPCLSVRSEPIDCHVLLRPWLSRYTSTCTGRKEREREKEGGGVAVKCWIQSKDYILLIRWMYGNAWNILLKSYSIGLINEHSSCFMRRCLQFFSSKIGRGLFALLIIIWYWYPSFTKILACTFFVASTFR